MIRPVTRPFIALGLMLMASYCHAATNKFDLQIFRGWADPCVDNQLVFRIRVYNWEAVVMGANQLTVEFYLNAPVLAAIGSYPTVSSYNPGGGSPIISVGTA